MKKKPRKIGILVNRQKPTALSLLKKLRSWCSRRGIAAVDSTQQEPESWVAEVTLVICLGGDGTLLSLAGKVAVHKVPILGVNLGSLGFLTEVKQDEVFEELERFLSGKSEIESRMMLCCDVSSARRRIKRRFLSLNDVVISREGLSRIVPVHIRINGEPVTYYAGDGIIIATPTGSTAYSLSAGGAVVHPTLDVMILTPICPHALSLRPMVVSSREMISIRLEPQKRSKALVTIDGQENQEIDETFDVTVSRSPVSVRLIKSSRRTYFETLSEKFRIPK